MKKTKGRTVVGRVPCLFLLVIAIQAAGQVLAPPAGSEPQPLASEGSTTTFRYWRSPSESNAYLVQPIGNTGFTFQVSKNYLGLVINSPPIDDKTRLSVLIQYPFYMDQLYQSRIHTSYPDAQKKYATPFSTFSIDNLVITQDSIASPYVRVRITEPGVPSLEFSINRDVVDQLLSDGSVVGPDLIAALRKYSYRLPEEARNNFSHLSSTQIMVMAAESIPTVSGQEFVRARRWYGDSHNQPGRPMELSAKTSGAEAPATSHVVRTQPAPRPAAVLTPRPTAPSSTNQIEIPVAQEPSHAGPLALLLTLVAGLMVGAYYWLAHKQR